MEGEVQDEDLERLANRLAMLVSDTGEADNAGRAVGMLARRLGLTGGRLKEVFLTGAAAALAVGLGSRRYADAAGEIARLERENAGLRQSLRMLDRSFRSSQSECDEMRIANEQLRNELDKQRSAGQVRRVIGITVAIAVIAGCLFLVFGPGFRLPRGLLSEPNNMGATVAGTATIGGQIAIVQTTGAAVRSQPDLASKPDATLPAGTRLVVRRLFWNNLMQWAEIELGSRSGYMLATDVTLP